MVTMQELLSISADGTSSAFSRANIINLQVFWTIILAIERADFLAWCSSFVVDGRPHSIGLLKATF